MPCADSCAKDVCKVLHLLTLRIHCAKGRVQSLAFAESAHTLCQRTRAKSLFSDSVYALCQGRVQRRFFLTVCMLNLRIHCATGRMQSRVSTDSAHTLSAHCAKDACAPTKKPCAHGTPGRLEDAKTACRARNPSLLRICAWMCLCACVGMRGCTLMYVDVRRCS